MMRFLRVACLGILLFPAAAKAADEVCTPSNEMALRRQTTRLVSALHIGSYRADGALLQKTSEDLEELLDSCPSTMTARLCDAECYYQRASVHLFRAQQMPLLRSKEESPDDGVSNRANLLREVQRGLLLLEEGLGQIARQHSSERLDADPQTLPFNRYLKSLGQLNGLKAKLLMAAGDLLYRGASHSHLEQLNYQIAKALDDTATPNADEGNEYYKATTYYQEAFWVIVEARTSLPNDQMFSGELATLAALEKETSLRLASVRKGHLYLNIDPDDFSLKDITVLGQQLSDQLRLLRELERDTTTSLQDWATRYQSLQDRNFDVKTAAHNRAIDLEAYKLAQIQELAGTLKNKVSGDIAALQSASSQFELEQRIRSANVALSRATMDVNHDLAALASQTERDLLGLEKERTREEMDEIRFHIDGKMADFNFEMQKDGLNLQLSEFDGRIKAAGDEIAIADNQRNQINARIALEGHRIAVADTLIRKARMTRDEVMPASRGPVVQNICAVNAEIAFYSGGGGSFHDAISGEGCSHAATGQTKQALLNEVCSARATAAALSKADLDKIKGCLQTGGCSLAGEAGSVYEAAKKIKDKNEDVHKAEREAWNKSLQLLDKRLSSIKKIESGKDTLTALKTLADAAHAAMAVASAVPPVTVGVMGVFPVALTQPTSILRSVAEAALGFATSQVEFRYQDLQFEHGIQESLHAASERMQELKGQIETSNKQSEFDKWNANRAIAEVAVRAAEIDWELHKVEREADIQTIQCRADGAEITATVAKLQANRSALIAQLDAQSKETNLIAFDIEQQEQTRAISQREIERLHLEHEEQKLVIAKLERERDNLRRMRQQVERQLTKVDKFATQIAGFRSEYDAKTAAIKQLNHKIEHNLIELNRTQGDFFASVLLNEQKVAFEEIAQLKNQLARDVRLADLQQQVVKIEADMNTAVGQSRAKIISLVANAPVSQHETVFWDFENLAAELTRGTPEILDHKRRLLENVNFVYNLYRNRYNMLAGLTNDVRPIDPDKPLFISNSGELETLLADCAALGQNEICHPGSLTWSREGKNGFVSEFTVDKTSGLVSELLDQGRVRFEISSFSESVQDSKNLGQFVFWDASKMGLDRSMVLLHAVAGVQGSSCGTQEIMLRHLGTGVLLSRAASASDPVKPAMVVKPPMSIRLPLWSGSTYDSLASQQFHKFENGPYLIEGLEAKLHDKLASANTVYPFVGYPLLATYELVADQNLVRCMSSGAPSLKLGFIYLKN